MSTDPAMNDPGEGLPARGDVGGSRVARIEAVTTDGAEPQRLAAFWAAALVYETYEDMEGWVLLRDPGGVGPMLGF